MFKLWFKYRTPYHVLVEEGMSKQEIRQYRVWENRHNKALFEQLIMGIIMIVMNILIPTGAMFLIIPLAIMCIKGSVYSDEVMIYM